MRSVFLKDIDVDDIKAKIDEYKCISFDVFDTLIKRNVAAPSDLYELMGKELEFSNFAKIRKNAEKTACRKNAHCTIDDVYDVVLDKIPQLSKFEIIKLEEKYELSYCQTNHIIKDVYDYAKQKKKRIIAVSDMYLSRNTISQILSECGYSMDEIYVSCEEKKNKSDGSLFEVVLKKEAFSKSEILHIGDSFKADYLGARKCGIKSVKIDRCIELFNANRYKKRIDEEFKYSIHKNIIDNNLPLSKSFYEKFGFSIIGPALFSYCKWIEEKCITNDISKVFFFARDGFLMKQAFDYLKTADIETKYLCVSRRALRVPYNASHSTIDEIIKLLPPTRRINVKVLVDYLGLNIEDIKNELKKYKLNLYDEILYSEIRDKYQDFLMELLPLYIEKGKCELDNAVKYLKQEGISGKVAVVDIGWHNTMQFCLENILKEAGVDSNIYGMYFGCSEGGYTVENSCGFIQEPTGSYNIESAGAFIGLIESFFLEQAGTTLKYECKDNKYYPIREHYEYETGSDEYIAYDEIHKGALRYIKIVNNLPNNRYIVLSGKDAYLPIYSIGIHPYMNDVSKFANFRYFSEGVYPLVGYKGIAYYLSHPKEFKTDLYNARWKAGFLKKLFKIDAPYYGIYKVMKKGR